MALMSSLSSLFNTSAMLFTVDFYKKFRPDTSERRLVYIGRLATVVIVILGFLWIPLMKGLGKVLYAYLLDVQSLLAPGIAAVFLLGVISKRTTPAAGYAGLVTGFIIGMLRLLLKISYGNAIGEGFIYGLIVAPNWLHFEIVLFFIIILIMIVISIFTKRANLASIQGLYFGSATPKQKAITRESWNIWDVVNSAIIMAIIILFYIYFW
jgi:solute:Na+ symporter, SSS family